MPGFGDPDARVLVLGLAPAAHGGNRTGRIFTGDRSGDFLFASMHATGLANQPTRVARGDGLRLRGRLRDGGGPLRAAGEQADARGARPCLPFLVREIEALERLRVIVALGAYAWDGALRALAALGHAVPRPQPRFGHAAEAGVGRYALLGCFHPSQQNTFTGRLTADDRRGDGARAVAASLARPGIVVGARVVSSVDG